MIAVDVAAVVLGAALLLGAGALGVAALRIAGGAERFIATLVLAAAAAVAIMELLSLGRWITRGGLLAGAAGALAVAGAAWARSGRPRPALHPPSLPALGRAARGAPVTTLAIAVAAVAATAQLVSALLVAPNEVDALLYHLLRSALVVQRHTVAPPQPVLYGDPVTMNPANAELLVAWTMGLGHTDRLAALVNWTSLMALGPLVFAGARLLGFTPARSAFAGALSMLLPEPLLQATTAQNDLALSVLVGCTAVFGVRGVRDRSRGDLVVAALAAGLAVGTKSSALLACAITAGLVACAALRYRAPPRLLLTAAVAAVVAVASLGVLPYVEDAALTGDPLGGMTHSTPRDFIRAGGVLDIARSGWSTFVEAPGLPRSHVVLAALEPLRRPLFDHLHGSYFDAPNAVRFDVDEDTNGLGLVGLLVLPPIALVVLIRGPASRRLLVLGGGGFVIALSAALGYSPDNARLVLPGLVLLLPLLALAGGRRGLALAALMLAVATAVPAVLLNPHRSPFTDPPLVHAGRHRQQLADYDGMAQIVDALDRIVPRTAPIAVIHAREFTYTEHPTYPLYDAHLRRRIVLVAIHDVHPEHLRRLGVTGALVWVPQCDAPDCDVTLDRVPHVFLGNGAWFIPAHPLNSRAPGSAGSRVSFRHP